LARIVVFYQYFCTPKGSWGTRHYEFARRWVASGHEVTVVTSVYDKSDLRPTRWLQEYSIDGIRVIVLNLALSNKHGLARRAWSFAAYAAVATGLALRFDADVVISSSGPISVGLPGLLAKALRRKRFVFEVRDLWPEGAIQLGVLNNPLVIAAAKWFEQLCYRAADQVITLSPAMTQAVRHRAPKARVDTISNAADLDLFYPDRPIPAHIRDRVGGRFVLLYPGTLGLVNNGGELVDIAAELKRHHIDDVLLVIIGDGRERPELEDRARTLALDNLLFLPPMAKHDIADWFAAAGATLNGVKPIPILSSCSPNKVFDSFAAGRPVIDNTRGWLQELYFRTQTGLSYLPGDVQTAVDLIVELKDAPDRRRDMGRRARALAESEFSRDLLAARYERIVAALAAGGDALAPAAGPAQATAPGGVPRPGVRPGTVERLA
jgi:glycosyltransferase involved in cell wall biosynthesis